MNNTPSFADALRQKLGDSEISSEMRGRELDDFIQNFYESGRHRNLLFQLAEHYKIEPGRFVDLLLARQLIYLNFMTDFSALATEDTLQNLLKHQNANVSEICDRLAGQISGIDEAVRQTAILRDNAARVLACLKKQTAEPAK